ncbi:hypothetical protein [Pseudomonas protegens]|uniref:hypothetical protein n=1 Tax=Pseudomonas protegens TaxID=380021 RepID=UPI002753EBCD|nr:hypothetical protein [Pseudomonas protegens]MDP9528494.1 hypothetical protein [Pseudomonas protegens]
MSELPKNFPPKDAYLLGILRSIQGLAAAVCHDPKMRLILEESLQNSLKSFDNQYDEEMIKAYSAPIGATLHVVDQVKDHISRAKS